MDGGRSQQTEELARITPMATAKKKPAAKKTVKKVAKKPAAKKVAKKPAAKKKK